MKRKSTHKRALFFATLFLFVVAFSGCGQKGMEVTLENMAKQGSGEVLFAKYNNITQEARYYSFIGDDGVARDVSITIVHNKMEDGRWARFESDSSGYEGAIYQDALYEKAGTGEVYIGAFLDDGSFEKNILPLVNDAITFVPDETEKIVSTKTENGKVYVTIEFLPDEYEISRWGLAGGKCEGVYVLDAETLLALETEEYHVADDGTRTLLASWVTTTNQPFTEPAFMEEIRNATELRTLNAIINPGVPGGGQAYTFQAPVGAYFSIWWVDDGEWENFTDEACTIPFEPGEELPKELTVYYKKVG